MVPLHGVILHQVQDPALPLAELQEVLVGSFLRPIKAPVNGSRCSWCISCSSQFRILCKLAEGALRPITQVINKDVE